MQEIYPQSFKPKKAHYAPGILSDDGTLYISGQLSLNPQNGEIAPNLDEQVYQALDNLEAVLNAAKFSKNDVLMCRVYTPDIDAWEQIDEIYAKFFGTHKPARVIVPTTKLHFGCLIEIEAIAKKENK